MGLRSAVLLLALVSPHVAGVNFGDRPHIVFFMCGHVPFTFSSSSLLTQRQKNITEYPPPRRHLAAVPPQGRRLGLERRRLPPERVRRANCGDPDAPY